MAIGRVTDETMSWFPRLYGHEWDQWRVLSLEYLQARNGGKPARGVLAVVRGNLVWFLEKYLWAEGLPARIEDFFACGKDIPDLTKAIARSSLKSKESRRNRYADIYKFIEHIIAASPEADPPLENPFLLRGRNDGRSSDITFSWVTLKYGMEWETWRHHAEEWTKGMKGNLTPFILSINWFFESYLMKHGVGSDPVSLLDPGAAHPDLMNCLRGHHTAEAEISRRNNLIADFVDWLIRHVYSEMDDNGQLQSMFVNPFGRVKHSVGNTRIETVHNALPYSYIKELRDILCPNQKGDFRDWTWAQAGAARRDWFAVDDGVVDTDDADCVYRTTIKNGRAVTEMWSPTRMAALLIKLHLPLRSYQVRMLDSGEADTWRYVNGGWTDNTLHNFVQGSKQAPYQRGVFRRTPVPDLGEVMTALYINTNKTADQNKELAERGYVIPWENDVVLHWLEKLRNWQEKYNPIDKLTNWTDLDASFIGHTKAQKTLKEMGACSFLFRDRLASQENDKDKPIVQAKLNTGWYDLLAELEDRLFERGQTLKDGSRIRLVKRDQSPATEFPLHSLRVSLITCYAMDGHTPLPVISKLLAGHSRILMTIYYNKLSPAVMKRKMTEAEALMDAGSNQAIEAFLEDADLRQIKHKTAYIDESSITSALVNRNPLGWEKRHIGLCLVGGNTADSEDSGKLSGCWNGGGTVKGIKGMKGSVHGAVPHGPENCVRCRWFITDATYLDALRAHFNSLSYRASQASRLAVEIEHQKELLEDERFIAETRGLPFMKVAELKNLEKRCESQIVEADEYLKDMRACFTLIHRIVDAEHGRTDGDDSQKLIAIGSADDIHQPLGLIETSSELWQLSELCQNAEIYPQLADDTRKTPIIEKRSRALNRALVRDGYDPVFMHMDDNMQLIMGNAFMRAMAKKVRPENWSIEGIRIVSGLIETQQSLESLGVLGDGIAALEEASGNPLLRIGDAVRNQSRTATPLETLPDVEVV
jgi:hypothetical protein